MFVLIKVLYFQWNNLNKSLYKLQQEQHQKMPSKAREVKDPT